MDDRHDLVRERHRKLERLLASGLNPFTSRFAVSHLAGELQARYTETSGPSLEEASVQVRTAGRLIAFRPHGKATFGHVRDRSGQIQVYVKQEQVGPEAYGLLKAIDIGDFLGVEGTLFRTKTGELTIRVTAFQILAKSLRPLPEKWHGLTDIETRYRKRYLDLIANPTLHDLFRRRSQVIREIRAFFDARDFLEVETPMMQAVAGGAAARPFITHHNALDVPLFLRIAPELFLKRLLVGGMERVYEINRNFRNEGISTQHNPEFTMLEFYQAYADYRDLMELTEALFLHLGRTVLGGEEFTYQGHRIVLSPPWPRITLLESLVKIGGMDEQELRDDRSVRTAAESRGISLNRGWGWGKIIGELFEKLVEEKLTQPTFIIDFPVELSPLAKAGEDDPRLVERFELFLGGLEVANAYTELNDPREQRSRFLDQLRQRALGDEAAHAMDEDYLEALEYGMPPAAGEGIGIDRLVMLFTDAPSIREVILFPLLRPRSRSQPTASPGGAAETRENDTEQGST